MSIDQLKAGKVSIYEQYLDEALKCAVAEKKITLADAGEAIRAGEVIFICGRRRHEKAGRRIFPPSIT